MAPITRTARPLLAALALVASTAPAQAGWKLTSVEANPFRVYTTVGSLFEEENESYSSRSFAGGVHFGEDGGHLELAFPFAWYEERNGELYDGTFGTGDASSINVDVQLRWFPGDGEHDGFYAGPTLRYARASIDRDGGSGSRVQRPGYGIVLGWRAHGGSTPLYWGTGVTIGRFTKDWKDGGSIYYSDSFSTNTTTERVLLDIEVLKFGYRF